MKHSLSSSIHRGTLAWGRYKIATTNTDILRRRDLQLYVTRPGSCIYSIFLLLLSFGLPPASITKHALAVSDEICSEVGPWGRQGVSLGLGSWPLPSLLSCRIAPVSLAIKQAACHQTPLFLEWPLIQRFTPSLACPQRCGFKSGPSPLGRVCSSCTPGGPTTNMKPLTPSRPAAAHQHSNQEVTIPRPSQ